MKESFTQLLVHLDATPQAAHRLAAARAIAASHGAAVTALYAVTPAMLEIPFAVDSGPNAASVLMEVDRDRRGSAKKALDRANASEGPEVSWAETSGFPLVSGFSGQALYADLMVLGQHDASDHAFDGVAADFVESVLAQSGKPALVLPHHGESAAIGDTVVIAWKPTREAARAIAAAMPLLQRARRVHVVSWGDAQEAVDGARLTLQGHLARRGVDAQFHHEGGPEPEQVGELLLSRACDLGADLLVMGCYGHGRAREWVLGGASRTILRSMTLPVVMSH
ncbi:MAG: universal stress protein [Pseudomonadota bacterium]